MKKLLAGVMFLYAGLAYAVNLNDVYRDALASDPTFQQAYATFLANREELPQARSGLLPSLDMSATWARMVYHVRANHRLSAPTEDQYNSQTYTLTVPCPLVVCNFFHSG